MLDWGMCGTIVAVIAFGYSIWVEHKLKKLNDYVANIDKFMGDKLIRLKNEVQSGDD